MAKPPKPLPPTADLVHIIQAAVANAEALADDAAYLMAAGRVCRAHSLAVLAVEEMGKALLCIIATFPTPEVRNDFWKHYNSHGAKLAYAHGALTLLLGDGKAPVAEQLGSVVAAVAGDSATKLSGLYVDYVDTDVRTPADSVTAEDARAAILAARTLVDEIGVRWTGEEVLARLRAAQEDTAVGTILDQARDAAGQAPEALLGATRRFYHDPLGLES
ncbi:AbiV family abortive infection protein [Embleya sp. NPDC059237]|uniref:AbiV family abortive infection protein n=1 Tax=Embleya sp. NPDC059237 TaxID=3346784 RepID=UPI0036A54E78